MLLSSFLKSNKHSSMALSLAKNISIGSLRILNLTSMSFAAFYLVFASKIIWNNADYLN